MGSEGSWGYNHSPINSNVEPGDCTKRVIRVVYIDSKSLSYWPIISGRDIYAIKLDKYAHDLHHLPEVPSSQYL